MDPSRFRRLRRIEGQDHARSLTFTCFENKPFLRNERANRWLIEAIIRARSLHAFDLWAWVAMPNHVHLLIYPTNSEQRVRPILASIKLSVARRAISWASNESPRLLQAMRDTTRSGRTTFRFWQPGGGYDRNLVTPIAIRNEVRYIHANPVRAGLCDSPESWLWSSALEHRSPGIGPISIDAPSLRLAVSGG